MVMIDSLSFLSFLTFTGQELKASQYQPPKPRPMVRPAYLQLVASPAGN